MMRAARIPALIALIALAAAVLGFVLLAPVPAGAQTINDYDSDDDNLIEVRTLQQLNAIRWDPNGDGDPGSANTSTYYAAFPNPVTATRMGCLSTCAGYELAADLDFDADSSGSVTSMDPYPNWAPIGGNFAAVFDGNGRSISNLTVTGNTGITGLFRTLHSGARVRDLAIVDASVTSNGTNVGVLAGASYSGSTISAVSVQGGSVTATRASVNAGGLVGLTSGIIRASYSTASINAPVTTFAPDMGGLVGESSGIIVASYVVGAVSGTGLGAEVGGFAGVVTGGNITDSYCNTSILTPTTTPCVRTGSNQFRNAEGKTTAELQAPTAYTGIYANWNISLDGDIYPDNPWSFGASSQYPVLNTPAQRRAAETDYDADADGLIDVDTLYKLNAIRYDLDGDGLPDSTTTANLSAYAGAFPGGDLAATSTRMGCVGGCAGYELTGDLDFDADSSGSVTSTDPYPNWAPIGPTYDAEFSGGGHTISNLTITGGSGNTGLFSNLGTGRVIRDVGIIDPSISGISGSGAYIGALVGLSGGSINSSYVRGGSLTTTAAATIVGGLAGRNFGHIRASWSTASVNAGTVNFIAAGGLVGNMNGGTTTASYAAGAVTGTGTGNNMGGLVGEVANTSTAIIASYCDTSIQTPTTTPCVGNESSGASVTVDGKTTAELQAPMSYTGIYANWNVDLDGDAYPDNPWNFGTSSAYPTLNHPDLQEPGVDYDADDDNLIDVSDLHQLNAIRHDLDGDGVIATASRPVYAGAFVRGNLSATGSHPGMGCPDGCAGYELAGDLDFDADSSGSVTSTDPYPNWTPIGVSYAAVFDGNGRTISNLTIAGYSGFAGLFNTLASAGVIRDLGMIDASVSGGGVYIGVVAGRNFGTITAVSVRGGSVTVTGSAGSGGGLTGINTGVIRASYSMASVDGGNVNGVNVGGLTGFDNNGTTTASYAAGAVSGTGSGADVGGVVGQIDAGTVIADSYCDTTTTTACIGSGTGATVAGQTAAELQAPTGYTGIYRNWNISLDDDAFPDNPWNFRSASQYPVLNTPAQRQAATADYDADDDGLIDVATLDQLNAIRHDLNGDGLPDSTSTGIYPAYAGAFVGGDLAATATRMGCVAGCSGYELTANLNFDADGVGGVTSTDPYPNWIPIGGEYTAVFDGNGRTISNLTIDTSNVRAGLFSILAAGSVIRDVGMVDASVSSGGTYVGVLAGQVNAGGLITAVSVQGGSVAVTRILVNAGGLVGSSEGIIRASYSTASVDSGTTSININIGGLMGWSDGTTTASYAAGAVSAPTGADVGGFVGQIDASTVITDSYCDTTTTTACIGSGTGATVAGQTSAALQAPTGYTGIYRNWNISLDDDVYPDNPWNFRAASQYPVLNTPAQRRAAADYDADDDGLIDVDTLDQLNAIRYDLDGDGLPDSAGNYAAYARVFPGGDLAATATRMGCVAGCAGYELTDDLNFDADGAGGVTSTDPYPNWAPIGGDDGYSGEFSGDGRSIANLTIDSAATYAGLFGRLLSGGAIRDVAMTNADVRGSGSYVGVVVGLIHPGAALTAVSVQGGSVTYTGNSGAGGLAGVNAGAIKAAYSTAAVNGESSTLANIGGLIGFENGGEITASYAAGRVTGTSTGNAGGFAGEADSGSVITDSYCDTSVQTSTTTPCVVQARSQAANVEGKTTAELQAPVDYTGIYENWNINIDADSAPDYPWYFGTSGDYPTLNTPAERDAQRGYIPPPPPPPTPGPGDSGGSGGDGGSGGSGGDTAPPPAPPALVTAVETVETYDAETAHPEIYNNEQYEMTATCQTHNPDPETGDPTSATITFNLGTYDGPVLLVLSVWRNQRYMAYETQDIPLPTLERDGQTATVTVETNPAQTRFRLDGRRYSLPFNLILGYADCHTSPPPAPADANGDGDANGDTNGNGDGNSQT